MLRRKTYVKTLTKESEKSMPTVSTSVRCVYLSTNALFHISQVNEMTLTPSLLKINLGDRQASLVLLAADDPQLVLGGWEALIAARAKGARWVWGAMFTSADLIEPNAARDGHLLAMIGPDDLIWR